MGIGSCETKYSPCLAKYVKNLTKREISSAILGDDEETATKQGMRVVKRVEEATQQQPEVINIDRECEVERLFTLSWLPDEGLFTFSSIWGSCSYEAKYSTIYDKHITYSSLSFNIVIESLQLQTISCI